MTNNPGPCWKCGKECEVRYWSLCLECSYEVNGKSDTDNLKAQKEDPRL